MCGGRGGLTDVRQNELRTWTEMLGTALEDGTRHAIGKEECLGSRQRRLIGNSKRDLYKI
jgi:hypothetical protein